MADLPIAKLTTRRTTLSISVVFVLLWVAYVILLGTRSDDVFGPFHNDVFWPAETYLTSAQPGLLLLMFGHVMVTLVGGVFLLAAVVGLLRLARLSALAPKICPALWIGLFVYSFLFLRVIPDRVTIVDREHHELRTRTFGPFSFLPSAERVIAGSDLRALGTKVENYGSRRSSDTVVRIYALSGADNERVLLGLRECPGEKTICLDAADDAVRALAIDLGREITATETNDDKTIRVFVVR